MPRNVSGIVAVHLHDVPYLGHVHKLIDQPLAVHLGQDAALVVIPSNVIEIEFLKWSFLISKLPQGSSHRLVVHVGLVLVEAPQPGHRLAVHQLEDALLPVGPFNELRAAVFVLGMFGLGDVKIVN